MLREAENVVFVEGILSEVDLIERSFAKDGKNTDAISGTIKVLVETEKGTSEIPFNLFATKYTNKGGLNPAYESIKNVKDDFRSAAACGSKEDADRVRISKGQIRMNPHFNNAGKLVNQIRLSASFISKITKNFTPKADFSLEFFVSNISPVVDKDGVEVSPRRLNVTAIVPGYAGKVEEVPLIATSPNVVNALEKYWEVGKTYKANGRLNFSSEIKEIIEEVDFGEPIKKRLTSFVNELIITGGSQAPVDEEFAFSLEDIRSAMNDRKARIEEQRNKPKKTSPAPAGQTSFEKGMDLGF